MRDSPFFKLSLEIRNEIYGDVLIHDQPIHILQHRRQTNEWAFTKCVRGRGIGRFGFQCQCELPEKSERIDVALFCVSKQVQQEAMAVFMSHNTIELRFIGSGPINDFTEAFRSRCAAIRSLNLRYRVTDTMLYEYEMEALKAFCTIVPALRQINILLNISKDTSHRRLWTDGVLNYFRLLSPLPLESATVESFVAGTTAQSASTLAAIKRGAEALLLRDSTLPLEPVVQAPDWVCNDESGTASAVEDLFKGETRQGYLDVRRF